MIPGVQGNDDGFLGVIDDKKINFGFRVSWLDISMNA